MHDKIKQHEFPSTYHRKVEYRTDDLKAKIKINRLIGKTLGIPMTTVIEVVYILQTQDIFEIADYLLEDGTLTNGCIRRAFERCNLFYLNEGEVLEDREKWEKMKADFFLE